MENKEFEVPVYRHEFPACRVLTTDKDWQGPPDFKYAKDPDRDWQYVTATHFIFNAPKTRYLFLPGSQGSSKTSSTLMWATNLCSSKYWNHYSAGPTKDKTVSDLPRMFESIARDFGIWDKRRYSYTKHEYKFANGSLLKFGSPDDAIKARGVRWDSIYFNEANGHKLAAVRELAGRAGSKAIFDWNPSRPFWYDWIFLWEMNDFAEIRFNFRANEELPQGEREEFARLKRFNPEQYRVVALGETGTVDSQVFKHWKMASIPEGAVRVCRAVDFGYDAESAVVEIWFKGGVYYLKQLLYAKGHDPVRLAQFLRNLPDFDKVMHVCDCKRKDSMQILARYGLPVRPSTVQGPGQKIESINVLQGKMICYTPESYGLIKELSAYTWAEDRFGHLDFSKVDESTPDHLLDATRYGICAYENYVGVPDLPEEDDLLTTNPRSFAEEIFGIKSINDDEDRFDKLK